MTKIFRFLFLLLLIFFLFAAGFIYYSFRPPQQGSDEERFVVSKEISQSEIYASLFEKGFFRNNTVFDLVMSYRCRQIRQDLTTCLTIEPGAYLVSKSMNAYELSKVLTSEPYQKWVTIPEGKRKEQVALILKRSLGWPEEKMVEFIKVAKEGYLYPDTYLINTGFTAKETAQRLTNAFNEKLNNELYQKLVDKNIRADTAIRFASLIERESGGDYDKPIIAAVIWNRLDEDMRLQIDATIQYILATRELVEKDYRGLEDFNFWPTVAAGQPRQTDSEYNTYLNDGLPPGPICSPSLASIEAVINPADTDALYYLHSPDRQIHTAKTYDEHKENIEKYLN